MLIVPAGSNRRDWVPSNPEELVKTASVEDGSETVERDEVLEAAMSVLESKEAETEEEVVEAEEKCECEKCECDPCECDDVKEAGDCCAEDEEVEIVLEDEPVEVAEEIEVEVETEDKVEDAVESIELALEDIKEAVGCEDEDEEVEDTTEFVADEVSDSVEEVEAEEEVEEEHEGCFATANGVFQRLAKTSPEVQKEIGSYWKELGLPSDYVDLMFKNYE
jgi:hypothetical protein